MRRTTKGGSPDPQQIEGSEVTRGNSWMSCGDLNGEGRGLSARGTSDPERIGRGGKAGGG